jgi:hypothetical protein
MLAAARKLCTGCAHPVEAAARVKCSENILSGRRRCATPDHMHKTICRSKKLLIF